jgi:DNA-binding transcriptional LysR family regulator
LWWPIITFNAFLLQNQCTDCITRQTMNLRQMRHVVALADERNFNRAAQRVHLSQPAFSRSIQTVEAALGLKLFDRGTLEVTCTAAGALVIAHSRKLLFDSSCLERDVNLFRNGLLGDLNFGVGPFPAATLLPKLMVALRQRYPAVNSRVEVNNWRYLVQHLRAEELDFFVADIRDVTNDSDLTVQRIGQQQGSFYVRTAHPLCGDMAINASAMATYGLASVRLPAEVKDQLRQLLRLENNAALPITVECDDVHLLKHIALASDTVLASTDEAVCAEVKSGQLHKLALVNAPPLHTAMGIVSLKGRSHSPIAEFAVNFWLAAA